MFPIGKTFLRSCRLDFICWQLSTGLLHGFGDRGYTFRQEFGLRHIVSPNALCLANQHVWRYIGKIFWLRWKVIVISRCLTNLAQKVISIRVTDIQREVLATSLGLTDKKGKRSLLVWELNSLGDLKCARDVSVWLGGFFGTSPRFWIVSVKANGGCLSARVFSCLSDSGWMKELSVKHSVIYMRSPWYPKVTAKQLKWGGTFRSWRKTKYMGRLTAL